VYQKRPDKILPAFYATVFFLLLIGGVVAFFYLLTIPMNWSFRIAAMLQFGCMLIIWVQVSFLSVIKQYGYVLLGFLAGAFLSIGISYVFMRLGFDLLLSAMWGAAIGFLVMMFLFLIQMLGHYPKGKFNLFVFFPALDKHKILVVVGFFMGLGLFAHNFVIWCSDFRNHVFDTAVYCTRYDIPTFFATLTITPLLVQFVVSLETGFSRKNRVFLDTILYGGRIEDIKAAKKDMENTLYRELAHMLEIQLIFTVISATVLSNVLQVLGLDNEMLGIYRILCFGYCFYGMVKSFIIILLYFDDKVGACIGSVLFALSSILCSIITLWLGIDFWGAGFLAAAAITTVFTLIRLKAYLKKLEYHIFCEQELFQVDEKGIFQVMEEWFTRLEREFKQRSIERAEKEK